MSSSIPFKGDHGTSRSGFHNAITKRATVGERVMGALFPSRGVGWPGGWSADRLEQVAHLRGWTYVAIDAIACQVAQMLPNMAYVSHDRKPGITRKRHEWDMDAFGGSTECSMNGHSFLTNGAYRRKALSVIKPHEELEPIEAEHPLRRLIENPNPVDTSFDLLYETAMFEELTGVSYLWAIPNGWGVPCELWCIPSHWVFPRTGGQTYVPPDDPHADELIHYYEVRPWGGMGSAGLLKFPPNEIIRCSWKSPINKIDGYSKLQAAARWIDTEDSINISRWSQFINQARPEFWVELGEQYSDFDEDQLERVGARFMARYQGETNFGKPIFTPPGAKVQPISFNPTEMSYFECLDAETECLTAEGWKRQEDLTPETRIACYDEKTGTLIYRKPSKIFREHYKGPMHRWQGQMVDALMTPNHRVLVDGRIMRVDELKEMETYGVLCAPTPRIGFLWSKEQVPVLPRDRSIVEYEGLVWCVTVPTGLFVVRRNGKAHITGNSINQIRDMILSTFRVPPAVVGIVNEMTFGSILATLMSFYGFCHDEETECLTSAGWKSYDKLTTDTEVACFDPDTQKIVYRKPSRIVQYDYDGPMHEWKTRGVSIKVTPKHRMYTQYVKSVKGESHKHPWKILEVQDHSRTSTYRVRQAAEAACDDPTATEIEVYTGKKVKTLAGHASIDPDVWLEFLGYYISEGHLSKKKSGFRVSIYQAINSEHVEKIENCLRKTPFAWKRDRCGVDSKIYCWRVNDRGLYEHLERNAGRLSGNVKVPDYVKSWPAASLRILLDALIAGDGSGPHLNNKTGIWRSQYGTVSKQLADDVMELCVKCGLRASINCKPNRTPTNYKYAYVVNICSRQEQCVPGPARTIVDYKGKVWCVTVPTGLFVVRRDGYAHITGNCINPRLRMKGLNWSKFLAPKFEDKDDNRRVRIWWDDGSPADPAQVNSDITTDFQCAAITPSEIRAIRGRRPYEHGGDDPLVSGPGGLVPLPLATGEDLRSLGGLVPTLGQGEEEQQGQPGAEQPVDPLTGMPMEGAEQPNGGQAQETAAEMSNNTDMSPAVEEPNSQPSKAIKSLDDLAREFLAKKAAVA